MRQIAAQQHGAGLWQPHKVVVTGVWPGVASAWGCSSDDVVYSNLFTGVHGNYVKPSIRAAGLDPDALPESDATAMNFGSTRKPWNLGLRAGHRGRAERGAGRDAGGAPGAGV